MALMYDELSGRFFKSSIKKIDSIIKQLNLPLMESGELFLNDVYDSLGLDPIRLGDKNGWKSDNGLLEVRFFGNISPKGKPFVRVEFFPHPQPM